MGGQKSFQCWAHWYWNTGISGIPSSHDSSECFFFVFFFQITRMMTTQAIHPGTNTPVPGWAKWAEPQINQSSDYDIPSVIWRPLILTAKRFAVIRSLQCGPEGWKWVDRMAERLYFFPLIHSHNFHLAEVPSPVIRIDHPSQESVMGDAITRTITVGERVTLSESSFMLASLRRSFQVWCWFSLRR